MTDMKKLFEAKPRPAADRDPAIRQAMEKYWDISAARGTGDPDVTKLIMAFSDAYDAMKSALAEHEGEPAVNNRGSKLADDINEYFEFIIGDEEWHESDDAMIAAAEMLGISWSGKPYPEDADWWNLDQD